MATAAHVSDERVIKAPALPEHRPPTKQEVLAHHQYIYETVKDDADLKATCRSDWVWMYVQWFNRRDWRKQPGWREGLPVLEDCVPKGHVFYAGEPQVWAKTINECWTKARAKGGAE